MASGLVLAVLASGTWSGAWRELFDLKEVLEF